MSDYLAIMDATTRALERRTRAFRDGVVATVLIGFASIAWAMLAGSFAALCGLGLLVPLLGCFVLRDLNLLEVWRAELLASWVRRELDFAAFQAALRAHPGLPKETRDSMLATLPCVGELATEQALSVATRQAIACELTHLCRSRTDALSLKAAASVVVAGAVMAVAWTRRWEPLLVLGALALLPCIGAWVRRRRRRRLASELARWRDDTGFNDRDYIRIRRASGCFVGAGDG